MRKTYFLLILCTLAITIALLLAACAKTGSKGATGPAGPQGPAGLQGTSGSQGTAGPAGSQILSGPTTPTSTTGTQKKNLAAQFSPGAVNFYLADALDENDPGLLFTTTLAVKPPVTTSYLYRIILIPGGVAGTGIDPHQLTYNEVCTKFGIQP
jgi:hypothetical protein